MSDELDCATPVEHGADATKSLAIQYVFDSSGRLWSRLVCCWVRGGAVNASGRSRVRAVLPVAARRGVAGLGVVDVLRERRAIAKSTALSSLGKGDHPSNVSPHGRFPLVKARDVSACLTGGPGTS